MSRNFGLGSRDMGTAGQYALNNSARDGAVSFLLPQLMATGGNLLPIGRKKKASRKWKMLLKSWSKNMARNWPKRSKTGKWRHPPPKITYLRLTP